jgi:hypothetical protein
MRAKRTTTPLAPEAAVYAGGNGPDWQAYTSALKEQQQLTLRTSVELAQGLYQSPAAYLPGLPERYRRVQ